MRRLTALVTLAVLVVPILPAAAQTSELPGDCVIDEAASVRVLLLIDQSGSLASTDPNNQRITGARAVVQSYASLEERVQGVQIQVAGFGEAYRPGEWVALSQDTLGSVLERVDTVGSVNDQFHTDYVYALDGAAGAFAEAEPATCQILFWFTDGEHDLDADLLPAEGLQRFYFPQPVTPANVGEAVAMMPGLICDPGGYADQLGERGVNAQIMLLGDESRMSEASSRVLRGMGGDPALDCGPGNGSFQSAEDATRLPFLMACAAQVGANELTGLTVGGDGRLVVTDQTVDAGAVPSQLATEIRLIGRGSGGSAPALAATSLTDVTELADTGSGTNAVVARPVGAPFSVELSGVVEACGFVTAAPATPVVQSTSPSLYQNEPGEFLVVAEGPHGRLEGPVLGRLQVTSNSGQVAAANESGWAITVPTLPEAADYTVTVEMVSGPGLSQTATGTFALNEQINAPAIVSQPGPVSGEGAGPFLVDIQIDPRDGGELCLVTNSGSLTGPEEGTITATADLDGSDCVSVEPGGTRTVTIGINLDRSGFAHGVLEFQTRSIPSTLPDRSEEGLLAVDLEVTPRANPILVALIVLGLMLLMLGLLWAIVYGVNRLIGRIPDPRRNRIRYADFVAEVALTEYGEVAIGLAEAPVDTGLRTPRRTPARLDAGRLRVERVVSVLPWVAPHAEFGLGTDLIGAHLGPGLPGRSVFIEERFRGRARDALGPLVAIGLTASQLERLAEGTAQKVPGVLMFDIRQARGTDASRFAADLIGGSLELIAAEISTQQLLDNMERAGET